ncbi:MAG TPA: DUF308 domain-containing protein [Chitinophagaceae bacterium]|nr:DUF308 domain-containing protein [Chitinophagaceae bacterium]
MKKTLYKARIHLLISGICSLSFGVVVLAFPFLHLLSLLWLFAGYMLLKGLALSLGAWRNRKAENHWMFLMAYGILNIVTGVIARVYPDITLLLLGFIVSINLLVGGVLQIIMAIHLHKEIKETVWLVLSGIITLTAGLYIYLVPRIGATTILYLIAASALAISIFLIALSLRAISWHPYTSKPLTTP